MVEKSRHQPVDHDDERGQQQITRDPDREPEVIPVGLADLMRVLQKGAIEQARVFFDLCCGCADCAFG